MSMNNEIEELYRLTSNLDEELKKPRALDTGVYKDPMAVKQHSLATPKLNLNMDAGKPSPQTLSSTLTGVSVGKCPIPIFSLKGKISRLEFFITFFLLQIIGNLLSRHLIAFDVDIGFVWSENPLLWAAFAALVFGVFATATKRLRDTGRDMRWIACAIIPVANIVLLLFLLFAPSKYRSN